MIEELLKGECVLFIEKKDGTINRCHSQLGAQVITADDDTGGAIEILNGYTVTFKQWSQILQEYPLIEQD
jgi:hypothetical protein